ncbi:hypothetical protein HCZ30_12330 [Marivivens donghaensis]|uniref:Uncharacterized protein n=1 Tax=Marivivens donghaensis TaxID=1699413 RepID=A0ABX0W2R6_9RHOB|nr:hypothetical protein [Marivivens donghaensis]NIY73212.1 hypothetical protein [Marivivens donghaensis]
MTIKDILWRKTPFATSAPTRRAKDENRVTRDEIASLFAEELGYRSRRKPRRMG